MSNAEIETQLMLVYNGEITFSQAASRTMTDWRKMAKHVARAWQRQIPAWYGADDVLQELLFHASVCMWRWDADKKGAAKLGRFTIWNALVEAKRAMHTARGATIHGSAGKNPSHFERPFSAMLAQDESEDNWSIIDQLLRVEPEVERARLERDTRLHEAEDALEVCGSGKERAAVLAMAEAGSFDGAVDVLYADRGMRVAFRISNRRDAELMVATTVEAVAERLGLVLETA